eukprot:10026916-Karenia_brevis.AAC.1
MFIGGEVARFAESIIRKTWRGKLKEVLEDEQTRGVISRYLVNESMRATRKTTITTTIVSIE